MSHIIFTHCDFHIGDNILHLHLVRALAKQHPEVIFNHCCHGCHMSQLTEVVEDLSNIRLYSFESSIWAGHQHESLNVWKNHEDAWVNSPLRWNFSEYYLWWHGVVARRMGFESPFSVREHLLFDYPMLELRRPFDEEEGYKHDFLIGDSAPSSGQYSEWADHSKEPLKELITKLSERWDVLTTSTLKADGHSISGIGRISQLCKHHIMIPNGPFFPTLNTHNHHSNWGRERVVLIDNGEFINMPHITQCSTVKDLMIMAKFKGWI